MKERLMILDGSSLLFRAFYALPPLTSPQGEYTNAIHGFSNMLVKMIQDYQPTRMAVAFDKSRHTFRTEMYAEYKGTREKTPEEFSSQVPILRDFLDAWGIPFLELDNYEADDIIGTISAHAAENGDFDVLIVTGDRDALQLIRRDVRVLYTKKGISNIVVFDEDSFRELYGFAPVRLIDLKGLMGDSSDNIPGVPGIGEKTAKKLLIEYGSLEGVYEHLNEISGKKLKERLAENREKAELSKRLATIDCNAPIHVNYEEYIITPDKKRFAAFCERYGLNGAKKGFEKIYSALGTDGLFAETCNTLQIPAYDVLDTVDAAEIFCAEVRKQSAPAVSFIGLYKGNVPHVHMIGAGIASAGKLAFAEASSPGWTLIWDLINDASVLRSTYDVKSFYHAGGDSDNRIFDVALAGYLLDASQGQATIFRLHEIWLPDDETPFDDNMATRDRAVCEALTVEKLADCLQRQLETAGLNSLYYNMELPLVKVLASMERTGIFLDRACLEEQKEAAGRKIAALEEEIYSLAGHSFNINSTKQLGTVLFEELSLPAIKKTKSGFSTNAEVLESLRSEHPIIEKILDYRLWIKLKSTYLDSMGTLIDEETQRVHTSFNQMVTATGRLSSSNPNLQNIPVRTEEGRAIRQLFRPGVGYDYLLSADYSQIELRILAHLSGDSNFIRAFQNNEDIHARTASEVFGVPMESVSSELRRHAKAVNFGIVYGISDYGLSRGLGISRKEAAKYIENYFEKCQGVKTFMNQMVQSAHQTGYVTTMFGRRRKLLDIQSKNHVQRALAERMAMNTPIQGSAADIIKYAMIAAYEALQAGGFKSRILLQVHDELVLEVTQEEVDAVSRLLTTTMENAAKLAVPLTVDIHQGKTWAEAK
jgi:DNA polymerase-1